ncbi:MAG: hypothetical protein ABIQ95_12590, partial [Bdellovibrionia bacterium]
MSKLLRWLACGVSVVLLSFWAVESRASDGARWEIWTGSLADYTKEFNTGNYSANFLGKNSELNPSLGYFVNDHWEILLAPSIGIQGSGNYSVNFMAGGAFNFLGDSLRDHAFVKAYFGFDDMLDNRI